MATAAASHLSFLSSTSSLDKAPPFTGSLYLASPPASSIKTDSDVDFDIESFTHFSPDPGNGHDGTLDTHSLPVDLSCSASTPSTASLAEVSPKSSASLGTPEATAFYSFSLDSLNADLDPSTTDAIALSNHHFQRYLHYKALAAQAEEQAAAAASLQKENDQIEAFLASISMPSEDKVDMSTMMPYQTQGQTPFYGMSQMGTFPQQSMSYPPSSNVSLAAPMQMSVLPSAPAAAPVASATAAMAHAQAQAHMQAHDAVLARAQHQRSLSMSFSGTRSSLDGNAIQAPAMWSRASTQSTTSPPFPSTPHYSGPIPLVAPFAPMMVKSNSAASAPAPIVSAPMPVPVQPIINAQVAAPVNTEGENELDSDEDMRDDSVSSDDVKPVIGLTNLHGGGRGYIPGKTPDDPKKRHKCQICGRGFARAFNLKVRTARTSVDHS